jgi:hypothetical protein
MRKKTEFYPLQPGYQTNQPGQPVPVVNMPNETTQERFTRLKRTADATGRRFIHVYLEDEKRRKGMQRW